MSARLFVALDLPAPAVEALAAWAAPLARAERGLRAVPPESLHLTLAFLGSRPEAAIGPLGELVGRCAGPVSGLALGAPLWLPRRRPRVLAVALEDAHGQLGALQDRLVGALAADGWQEPETRPFLPHVTVARVRGEGDRRPEGSPLGAAPPPLAFDGAAVTLYRSRLGPLGARYEPQRRVALA